MAESRRQCHEQARAGAYPSQCPFLGTGRKWESTQPQDPGACVVPDASVCFPPSPPDLATGLSGQFQSHFLLAPCHLPLLQKSQTYLEEPPDGVWSTVGAGLGFLRRNHCVSCLSSFPTSSQSSVLPGQTTAAPNRLTAGGMRGGFSSSGHICLASAVFSTSGSTPENLPGWREGLETDQETSPQLTGDPGKSPPLSRSA